MKDDKAQWMFEENFIEMKSKVDGIFWMTIFNLIVSVLFIIAECCGLLK